MADSLNNTYSKLSCKDMDYVEYPIKGSYAFIAFLPTPLHIFNIVSIAINRRLHQNVYFILMNLSISDSQTILTPLLVAADVSPGIYMRLARTVYTAFILSTCAITLDRYIKIEYALRYSTVCTKRRLGILVLLIWCSAGGVSIIGAIPLCFSNIPATKIEIGIHRTFNIICILTLITSSIYVWRVRKKHMIEIKKRRQYFGVYEEEFNLLKSMATGIKEVIQLNLVTSLLVLIGSFSKILNVLCVTGIDKMWFRAPGFIFYLSNPVIYMFIMTDLRNHYLRVFGCRRQQRQTAPNGLQMEVLHRSAKKESIGRTQESFPKKRNGPSGTSSKE